MPTLGFKDTVVIGHCHICMKGHWKLHYQSLKITVSWHICIVIIALFIPRERIGLLIQEFKLLNL